MIAIVVVAVAVVVLLSIAMKVRRGSFFRGDHKDEPTS
jgi:hypothetical protein